MLSAPDSLPKSLPESAMPPAKPIEERIRNRQHIFSDSAPKMILLEANLLGTGAPHVKIPRRRKRSNPKSGGHQNPGELHTQTSSHLVRLRRNTCPGEGHNAPLTTEMSIEAFMTSQGLAHVSNTTKTTCGSVLRTAFIKSANNEAQRSTPRNFPRSRGNK